MTQQIAEVRRRRNQVWTAACRYGYQPDFLSNVLYMNLIIGLADQYYGGEWLHDLFDTWKGDRAEDAFDALAWLLLEQESYDRALPTWPALPELRQEYAAEFLGREVLKSRQEHLSADALASAVEKAHWQMVAGRPRTPLFPREAALERELLTFRADSPAQWRENFLDLLRRYYGFDGTIRAAGLRIVFDRRLAALLRRVLPHRAQAASEELQFGRAGEARSVQGDRYLRPLRAISESDRQYVESCFGRSACPPEELAQREQLLCRGGHADCHLWFTNGVPAEGKRGTESRHVAFEARAQAERNRQHYRENEALYSGAIRQLTTQIQNCLLVQDRSTGVPCRRGVLDPQRVWRATALQDTCVFYHREDEPLPSLSVELLLDASASRLNSQELIAAQGYILSESLRRCGIPVQVDSFCSIRGYTVLHTLKARQDTDHSRGVFRYFAAGWNRDSLALAAAGLALPPTHGERRLLLVLTDAHPNDSQGLRNGNGGGLSRDYDGDLAIQDTAAAVHKLRQSGIQVAALVTGLADKNDSAGKIYGQRSFTRIQTMERLATSAGALICRELLTN